MEKTIRPKTIGSQADNMTIQGDLTNTTNTYNIFVADEKQAKQLKSIMSGDGVMYGSSSEQLSEILAENSNMSIRRKMIQEELEKLQKLPLVYLDEICKKHKFELKKIDTPTTGPPFKFTFLVDFDCKNYKGLGEGASKKESKENAAYDLLEHLPNKYLPPNIATPKPIKEPEAPTQNLLQSPDEPTAAVQGVLEVDDLNRACQDLKVFCDKRGIRLNYKVVGEEGPDHSRTFTIQCTVVHQKETLCTFGKSSNKIKAKQLAALHMTQKVCTKF